MNNLLDELAIPLTPDVISSLTYQIQSGTTLLWSVGCLVPDELISLMGYRALAEGIPTVLTNLIFVIDERSDAYVKVGHVWSVSHATPEVVLLLGSDFPYSDQQTALQLERILKTGRAVGVRVVRVPQTGS